MKTIKLFVDKDMTSCACLRVKNEGSDYSVFECGIDLVGHLWVANYPHIYGYNLKDLVENICEWYQMASSRKFGKVESFIICDDTQALCTGVDMEDYYDVLDEKIKQTRKAFDDVKDKALRGMVCNPELEGWECDIKVMLTKEF